MITYASQSQSAAQSRFMQVSQGPSSHPENTKKSPVQKDRALRAIRKISLLFHGLNDFRVDIETVFLIGEAPILDVFDILTYSIDDGLMKVGIGLDEFRTETAAHTEEVRADQNLTVADITGPDADGSRLLQAFVISAAISVGTHSKTMAKAPASSKARASWIRRLAVSAFFPCTR